MFGGCSTKGQARPGEPQPIQMMRGKPQSGAIVSTAGPSQGANNAPSGGSVAASAASVGVNHRTAGPSRARGSVAAPAASVGVNHRTAGPSQGANNAPSGGSVAAPAASVGVVRTMNNYVNNLAFVVYPYICLAVFFMGSLARFDRDQYTWKSDSSQFLRTGTLRWGSNLFHVGILFLFFGHLVGQLMPHWMYEPFISAPQKQLLAIVAGGVAGFICFVGLTLLLHRRIFDPRIRLTSHRTDLAILIILWIQLVLGLVTLPLSWAHRQDAGTMLVLASYLQGIATLQPDPSALAGVGWPLRCTCCSA